MKSPTILRFDRTADGYLRWWAPVLAPMSVVLVDRLTALEPGLAGDAASGHFDILDIGCGTGNLLFELATRCPSAGLVGLDASDGMIAVARREQSKLDSSVSARLSYVSSFAGEMPFEDASFDVVTTAFMLQQVPDRPGVLREMRRLLRPGGILGICAWLDTDYEFLPDVQLEAALLDARFERPATDEKRAGHYVSLEQAESEMREAGFIDIAPLPANLDHAWSVADYVAYRTTTRDIELLETMPPDQKRVFVSSFERRLEALPTEDMVYRESVVSITARKG
jgi:SAM-dependent methyltransferase